MVMRKVHPAIAELRRRNRAAGQRLSPIDKPQTQTQSTSNSLDGQQSMSKVMSSSAMGPRSMQKNANSTTRPGRLISTVPAISGGRNGASNGVKNAAGAFTRKVPTKPTAPPPPHAGKRRNLEGDAKSSATKEDPTVVLLNGKSSCMQLNGLEQIGATKEEKTNCVAGNGDNIFTAQQLPPEKNNKRPVRNMYNTAATASAPPQPQTTTTAAAAAGDYDDDKDELESLLGYTDKELWNTFLSKDVIDVLEGDKLEKPFTTELWNQVFNQEEEGVLPGYYACVRCHVPLVAPIYQVPYFIHGIAAFSRLNKRAVELNIGVLSGGGGFKGRTNSLELRVRCRCCGGFLGILATDTRENGLMVKAESLFLVNSCCLLFVRNRKTRCQLDKIFDTEEEEMNDTTTSTRSIIDISSSDVGINFDDLDVFET